jgi:hypothetical protein
MKNIQFIKENFIVTIIKYKEKFTTDVTCKYGYFEMKK